jgi:4-amino-4-deoxy-L-arabinose transferase-like glycosyltransferase
MEFFAASQLVRNAGRWFSQYPPGHPALLAIGLLAGVPWLVNPLFAAGTVLLVFAVARRLLGAGNARLAALLYLLSPFALFMSASYMNHVTTGFFLALALYGALRAADDGGGWPLLFGLALAAAATIRPLEAAVWGAVLGAWVLARRGLRPAFVAGGACLVGLVPLFVYNALTTGHPLRFGYTLLWGPGHGLGFHRDPWGEPFTAVMSFGNTALDFQRLDVLLFSWPFPSLVFLLVALAVAGRNGRALGSRALLAGLLLAAPVGYFFYWHRDNKLGPRFLFASLIPVVLLTAAGITAVDRRLGRWRPAFRLFLSLSVLYTLGMVLPSKAGMIAGLEPEMKLHPEAEAERLGVSEAVVFVKVGWGSRLVSRLWGWRVPASESERSFRRVDGCRLQLALDEADSLAAAGRDSAEVRERLRRRLELWRRSGLPVKKGLLPDASVRVDTSQALPERCHGEVERDETGFTVYGPLVWRNDPWLRRGIVFARYFEPARNLRLMERYADREAYLYAPLSLGRAVRPVLRRLELGARESPGPEPRSGKEGGE